SRIFRREALGMSGKRARIPSSQAVRLASSFSHTRTRTLGLSSSSNLRMWTKSLSSVICAYSVVKAEKLKITGPGCIFSGMPSDTYPGRDGAPPRRLFVGDLHGCLEELEALLEKFGFRP